MANLNKLAFVISLMRLKKFNEQHESGGKMGTIPKKTVKFLEQFKEETSIFKKNSAIKKFSQKFMNFPQNYLNNEVY